MIRALWHLSRFHDVRHVPSMFARAGIDKGKVEWDWFCRTCDEVWRDATGDDTRPEKENDHG